MLGETSRPPALIVHLPDGIGAKPASTVARPQDVISHSLRKTPAATTAAAKAKLPHRDSATSARRDHHTERQPAPGGDRRGQRDDAEAHDDVEEGAQERASGADDEVHGQGRQRRRARPGAAAPARAACR